MEKKNKNILGTEITLSKYEKVADQEIRISDLRHCEVSEKSELGNRL